MFNVDDADLQKINDVELSTTMS